jgi:PPIC-type PPIASE domain
MREAVVFYFRLLCLMTAGVAFAQSVAPSAPQHKAAVVDDDDDDDAPSMPAVTSSLPPRTPVITISGVCKGTASKLRTQPSISGVTRKPACETVITRAEFEELAEAVQPGMSVEKRREFGEAYAKFEVMSREASKLGLDETENFEELMRFARAQILTQELDRYLQLKAAKISSRDITDYYRRNTESFERATFQRLFIPHRRQAQPDGNGGVGAPASGTSATDPMKAEAESLRQRAAAGEDLDQLQQEAFAAGGLKGKAPTSMGAVRRSNLPLTHASVFGLKPGEVSPVISDSTGFYVYKMISKDAVPLEAVKQEISVTLQSERMKNLAKGIRESSVIHLNDAYFKVSPNTSSNAADAPTGGEVGDTASSVRAQRR